MATISMPATMVLAVLQHRLRLIGPISTPRKMRLIELEPMVEAAVIIGVPVTMSVQDTEDIGLYDFLHNPPAAV